MSVVIARGTEPNEAAIRVRRLWENTYSRVDSLRCALDAAMNPEAGIVLMRECVAAGPAMSTAPFTSTLEAVTGGYRIALVAGQRVGGLHTLLVSSMRAHTVRSDWIVEVTGDYLYIYDPALLAGDGILSMREDWHTREAQFTREIDQ